MTDQLVSTVRPSSSARGVTVMRGRVRSPLDLGVSAMILPISKADEGPKTCGVGDVSDFSGTVG